MKKKTFISLYDFVFSDLHLSGNEAIVYSLIYSFESSNENNKLSLKYLTKRVNLSKPTIIKTLNSLVSKNLLEKVIGTDTKNHESNTYKIVEDSKDILPEGSKETLPDVVKNLYRGSKETLQGGSKETLPHIINKDKKLDNKNIKENILKESSIDDDPNEPSWNDIIAELRT